MVGGDIVVRNLLQLLGTYELNLMLMLNLWYFFLLLFLPH